MELAAVPAGDALGSVGLEFLEGRVILAQHRIGIVGEPVQGFRLRHRIGNGVQIVRRVVPRPVVLVEAAALLQHVRRRRLRRRRLGNGDRRRRRPLGGGLGQLGGGGGGVWEGGAGGGAGRGGGGGDTGRARRASTAGSTKSESRKPEIIFER